MKLFLILWPLGIISNVLYAANKTPKIALKWRMDGVKEDTDDKSKTYGAGKEFKFQIPYLRFGIKGGITAGLTYRVRFRLNKTLASDGTGDQTGRGLNYAYVEKKVNGDLKLRIGKQGLYRGGWEAALSSKEEYSFSPNRFSFYALGVGAFYQFAQQKFIFQVLNNSHDSNNQSLPLYGVHWLSSFFKGVINPIVSYHVDPFEQSAASKVKGKYTYLAFGNRLKVQDFTFDFDYLINKSDKTSAVDKAIKNRGYVARMAYQWGFWRPQMKYSRIVTEGNIQKATKGAGEDTDFHIALEYYPAGNTSFRYHVAHITEKFAAQAAPAIKQTTIKFGIAGIF